MDLIKPLFRCFRQKILNPSTFNIEYTMIFEIATQNMRLLQCKGGDRQTPPIELKSNAKLAESTLIKGCIYVIR